MRKTLGKLDLYRDASAWRAHLADLLQRDIPTRPGAEDDSALVSLVDEAHALIDPEREHGVGQYGFVTGLGPQAFHIIRCSHLTVFFLDPDQSFRARENTATSCATTGMSYGDYVEQLTYLLFLKMADERTQPPYNQPSADARRTTTGRACSSKDGDELFDHYRHMLEELGKQQGHARPDLQQGAEQVPGPGQAAPADRRPDRQRELVGARAPT